jgi:hypothetical protein
MKQVVAAPEAAQADGPMTFHYVMNRYRPFDDKLLGWFERLQAVATWRSDPGGPRDRLP